jgi:hypothetical protein
MTSGEYLIGDLFGPEALPSALADRYGTLAILTIANGLDRMACYYATRAAHYGRIALEERPLPYEERA